MVTEEGRGKFRSYLLAVVAVATAAAFGLAVRNVFGVASPFIAFYPAVILVVLVADVGPALLAITLSVLTAANESK